MKITKKRTVLFLLFIFPLIGFLFLSTGINEFRKLPVINTNVVDISTIDATKTLKDRVSVICFLGNDIDKAKGGVFNVNEKVYKKFIDHKKFQIIAISPTGNNEKVAELKKDLGAFTDMSRWHFISGSRDHINAFYKSLQTNDSLNNFYTPDVYLIDKDGALRGRTDDIENEDRKLLGYNARSVADLNAILKEDINVLYYEYYAAFKNKNKADRKQK